MKKSELKNMFREILIELFNEREVKEAISESTKVVRPIKETESQATLRKKLGIPEAAGKSQIVKGVSISDAIAKRRAEIAPIVVETTQLPTGELYVSGQGILEQMKGRVKPIEEE